MSLRTLRDWNTGDDNRDRGHLQEPPEAIRELQHLVAPPTGSRASTDPVPLEFGLAKIVSKGPNGEADYTDARYWIQRILVKSGKLADAVKVAEDTTDQIDDSDPPNIFTASNWAERNAGKHSLLTDGTIEVMYVGVYDAGDPQRKHYLFYAAPDLNFFVKITGPTTNTDFTSISTDGGVYDAVYSKDSAGLGASPPSCVVIVDDESLPSALLTQTHWVKSNVPGIARFSGLNTTNNLPIMHASGLYVETNNPVTIPNAAAQVWGRQVPYLPATTLCGDCCCTLEFPVRSGLFRTLQFDKRGQLMSVSAEHA